MQREIDIETWKRKKIFDFYKEFEDPFFNLTANIEVGPIRAFCKDKQYSFFLACLYLSTKAANEIEEFRLRLIDNKVICYDEIHPKSTILRANETFGFAHFEMAGDFATFHEIGKKHITDFKESEVFNLHPERLNCIYYTTVPWVSFTAIKHARSGAAFVGVPRIAFGKYFTQENKLLMPVSLEACHCLMDGFHAGQYFERLQAMFLQSEI